MTTKEKENITRICKEFASGFDDIEINGSEYLIVDPMSAYLNSIGIENKLRQLPRTNERPQVLIIFFKDGSIFIPAGGDLKGGTNWMWI